MNEPLENEIADAMLKVMCKWMPSNGEIYLETRMAWGYIWQDMQAAAKSALEEADHV